MPLFPPQPTANGTQERRGGDCEKDGEGDGGRVGLAFFRVDIVAALGFGDGTCCRRCGRRHRHISLDGFAVGVGLGDRLRGIIDVDDDAIP